MREFFGTTGLVGTDHADHPTALLARTWNVYSDPFVKPDTMQWASPAPAVHVCASGFERTS